MGGGRSGLFPSARGADHHQISLLDEPIRVYRRGATYVPGEGSGEGGMVGGTAGEKTLILITSKDVLERCMYYRLEAITEIQLISWLQKVLRGRRYSIERPLRNLIADGLLKLKATKTPGGDFDLDAFLDVLEDFERKLATL